MGKKIILVGAGFMAMEYAKVLSAMPYDFAIVGRGEESAKKCEEKIGLAVYRGGVEKYLNEIDECPQMAIVAVHSTSLRNVAEYLMIHGIKKILLEKPGGIDYREISALSDVANKTKTELYVAYNRRFYASVERAQEIIKEDGGVSSFNFEFTEWSHVIESLPRQKEELENLFMSNSSHVVDLAFFLGGEPREMSSYVCGKMPWYSKASAFAGAGISKNGAIFSYKANWKSAGRWSVEILTEKRKLLFEPLEQLKIQNRGEIKIEQVKIDDKIDLDFKAGLFKQVEAFISGDTKKMIDIHEQKKHAEIYQLMEKTGFSSFCS